MEAWNEPFEMITLHTLFTERSVLIFNFFVITEKRVHGVYLVPEKHSEDKCCKKDKKSRVTRVKYPMRKRTYESAKFNFYSDRKNETWN